MREYFIWLAKLVTFVVVIFFVIGGLIGVMAAAVTEIGSGSAAALEKKGVRIVELSGIIESSDEVVEQLYDAVGNDNVLGVVLDINSPGGAIAPSQAIYSAVKKLKEMKPIVAVMGAVAASGGCYASLGATKVFAQPGTMTGSIGVILQLPNLEELTDKIGVRMVTIKSGDLKDAGNSFRPMEPEELKYLQSTADQAHQSFIQDVAQARNLSVDKVKQFADGRILLGTDAKEVGLVDEFGDVYDAARLIYEISGEELGEDELPHVIREDDRFEALRQFLESWVDLPFSYSQYGGLRSVSTVR